MKATVWRRHMLAAAVTPAAALAANKNHGSCSTDDDPVFAAIERHRQASQALSAAHEPSDALLEQLQRAEIDAFLAWLTTPPTTLAGVIATLEHASRRPYASDYPDDHVYTHLAESTQYIDDTREIGEQFPQMIATALRQIAGS